MLSRDYEQFPLKRINNKLEIPIKEDVIELYITQNLSLHDTAKVFGNECTRHNVTWFCKSYNIIKDISLIKHQQSNTYKNFNIEKLNDIKEKRELTNIKKFGVKNAFQSIEKKEKIKQANIKNLGVEYPTQSKHTQEKIKLTNLNRRGVEWNLQYERISADIKKIVSDKELLLNEFKNNNITYRKEMADHLNISYSFLNSQMSKLNLEDYFLNYSSSYPQRCVLEELQKFYKKEIIINTRKALGNKKEIDIFLPEDNFGIEFNGNFWHSENNTQRLYHYDKSKLAETYNIFLYHIFEYEWETNKQKILSHIRSLLGLNEIRIYARNCEIKEIYKEKSKFLNDYHLQGNDKSNINLGLYYNDELISVMTFCKSRFNKKYEWELSRYCTKENTTVIGGASKLFKHFIKTFDANSIISYSKIHNSKGDFYVNLGFSLNHISAPSYIWTNNKEILSRYECQKHQLLKHGYIGNSETDIMNNRKYYKIYDCGNKVWVWNKN